MPLDENALHELAEQLDNARLRALAVAQISLAHPGLDVEDGYAIQWELRRRTLARGGRIVGMKAGLTSRAKMRQIGIDTPTYGFLPDSFAVMDGGELAASELIHPRVEPEFAFVLGRDLEGPGCNLGAVLSATNFVLPALEVIDSRYENFKFDLASVISDNSSSARFVLGGRCREVGDLDLANCGLVLEKNGENVAFGAGAAVLGHPAAAVALIANLLSRRGERLKRGDIILTGGVTEALPIKAGDHVRLRVQDLGSVSFRMV
jgi:2-oxo-3-hexenedioate decarboxylase